MGCDIHFYVEVQQDDGTWESADKWNNDDGYTHVEYGDQLYSDRNYNLFGILANVRNGIGFAGIKTGDRLNVIEHPRGLPADVSREVKNESDRWEGDGHSHSWLTLEEIKRFNWNQKAMHQGIVDMNGYLVYMDKGKPDSWCGAVSGPNVTLVHQSEMLRMIKECGCLDDGKSYYTKIQWEETYAESVGSFFTETIPKMEALGDPDKVRAVFWFDN